MSYLIDQLPVRGWDSFIPYTQPATMGIPAEVVYDNIRRTGIHFSEQTGLLVQKDVLDLQANVDEYPIAVRGCTRFLALHKVCYKNEVRYCPAHEPRCCNVGGNKFWYEDGFLRISPIPSYDEDEVLEVTDCSVNPRCNNRTRRILSGLGGYYCGGCDSAYTGYTGAGIY